VRERDYFDRLLRNAAGLNAKFPDGNSPFQIIARLCEEAGELAQAVNHTEGTGIKVEKYGEPDLAHLADEVHHVLRAALAIAIHYGIVDEVRASVDRSTARLRADGYLPQHDEACDDMTD
jgi:NTP pyrophosphatase (non-canonical NTP hydrolase)